MNKLLLGGVIAVLSALSVVALRAAESNPISVTPVDVTYEAPPIMFGDKAIPADHPLHEVGITQAEADELYEVNAEYMVRYAMLAGYVRRGEMTLSMFELLSGNLQTEMETRLFDSIGFDRMYELSLVTEQMLMEELGDEGLTPLPPCLPDCHVFPVPGSGSGSGGVGGIGAVGGVGGFAPANP
jgi:hypothetical protein